MKAFRATGSYIICKQNSMNSVQPFSIQIAAEDEADAAHRVISNIGSRHRVARKNIKITEIVPLKKEEVTDHVVQHLIGGAK
ncbi:MAG: 50S ribosomal protein LX [Methanomassiliicoccales archaeon]|nr:MAG: 50S ribosomal protein LX [Methanomassiliicoccales archaeon]